MVSITFFIIKHRANIMWVYIMRINTASSSVASDNSIYVGCGKTKGCFGYPTGCIESKDCSLLTTWAPDCEKDPTGIIKRPERYDCELFYRIQLYK